MATPNAGLCSFTGQRIHKCFISCCVGMFVCRGSSDILAKQFWGFLLLLNNTRPGKDAPLLDTATESQQQIFFSNAADLPAHMQNIQNTNRIISFHLFD